MTNGHGFRFSPLLIGMSLSISVGFWDVLLSLNRTGQKNPETSIFLTPLALTTGVVFAVYMISYYSIGQILIRVFKLQRVALAVSLAFLVGFGFLVMSLWLSITAYIEPKLFQLSLSYLLILIASISVYFTVEHFLKRSEPMPAIAAFAIAFPFLMGEIFLTVTTLERRIQLPVTLALLLFTIWIFHRFRKTTFPVRSLYFLAALVFLCPIVVRFQSSQRSALNKSRKTHKIKHVLLITVDTLRFDAISAYNKNTRPTSNIDQLAKDGVLFQNAVSEGPWTLPAISSIMTGVSPLVHLATEVRSA
ncbi:sulfatase-like hydrolase/transferase, partial [bacterium]|nr:sulfatase-like hydrolase/transferase [bacterium]